MLVRTALPLLCVFFLSGASGLLYQVVWVREFGQFFGNTIQSAALVAGVFVFGLGMGALLAGRYADRSFARDPSSGLRLYAQAEVAIGVLGLGILALLPQLEPLSARISTYASGDHGWFELTFSSYLLRYGLAACLLTPITLLMGATLTLLVRFLVGTDVGNAGLRIGLLYGANTAGAAAACLSVDLWLIPAFGLSTTQTLAVAGNFLAAAGAWAILRNAGSARGESADPPHDAKRIPANGSVRWTAVALAASGFAGMGMEILWYRFFSNVHGSYRVVFSLLLFTILFGMWLGSTAAGAASRRYGGTRWGHPALLYGAVQIAFAASFLCLLYVHEHDVAAMLSAAGEVYDGSAGGLGVLYELRAMGAPIVAGVALPAFFMGFAYPLANANVQCDEERVGQHAGWLYLGNALGSIAGSLATGFVLLPSFGIKGSALVLAMCAVGACLPLALSAKVRSADRRFFALASAAGGTALVILLSWSRLPDNYFVLEPFRGKPGVAERLEEPWLLAAREGLTENVVVMDTPGEGKTLFTNGHPMSRSTVSAQRYMRAFVHVPLLHLEAPRNVLVICFGVGNTTHSASLHETVEHIEVADLSKNVLEHAHHFADTNHDVLLDPRVSVFVNDGRQHLRMREGPPLDLVTLEPPPLQFAGVNALYSREFYELVRTQLRVGGFITQWLPIRQLPETTVRSMVRAFVDVFPQAILLNGSREEYILMGRRDSAIVADPLVIAGRLAQQPAVAADLAAIEITNPTEFFGMFAADGATLIEATRHAEALRDDRPDMEYSRIWFGTTGMPGDLFDVSKIQKWCPNCLPPGSGAPTGLQDHLKLLGTFYAQVSSVASRSERSKRPARPTAWSARIGTSSYREALRRSPYLRSMRRVGMIPNYAALP